MANPCLPGSSNSGIYKACSAALYAGWLVGRWGMTALKILMGTYDMSTSFGEEIYDMSNSEAEQFFKDKCATFAGCVDEEESEPLPSTDTGDGEDLIGTMAGDIEGTEAGGTPAGDMAGSLEEPLITTPDTDISLYEYWKIGYLTSTVDSNGLVKDNNFTLNYGTYIILVGDGDIYDAATFKGNVGTRGRPL